jgi:hypothetical protein
MRKSLSCFFKILHLPPTALFCRKHCLIHEFQLCKFMIMVKPTCRILLMCLKWKKNVSVWRNADFHQFQWKRRKMRFSSFSGGRNSLLFTSVGSLDMFIAWSSLGNGLASYFREIRSCHILVVWPPMRHLRMHATKIAGKLGTFILGYFHFLRRTCTKCHVESKWFIWKTRFGHFSIDVSSVRCTSKKFLTFFLHF